MALTQFGNASDFSPTVQDLSVTNNIDNGTQQLVTNGWTQAQTYAQTAFTAAQAYLNTLQRVVTGLYVPGVDPHLQMLDLNIAQFDQLLSTAPVIPANNFAFSEIPYSDQMLTDLRAALLQWIDGTATGILPSVEQAIYDRGRAREAVVANRKAQEATRQFAMRGFPKPPGALSLEIQDAVQEAQNTSVTLNRDIIIKQAELEQSNRRFSFEQGWKMQEGLISYTNQQMQRAIDRAKTLQQFTVDIFREQVAEYGVQSQVYGARVGAETSAFSSKVNQQVAEGNLRIEAVKTQMQVYVQDITLVVEAVKAAAQVSGQLAASALSSIQLSGQLADHNTNSTSTSATISSAANESISFSAGANYNYAGTTGVG